MKKMYIKHILLIIIIAIQGIFWVKYNEKEEKIVSNKNIIEYTNNKKDINKIFNDFKDIKGVTINSIDNENKTKINIDFRGDRKSLVEFLKNTKEYCVSDYEIKYENKKFSINLSLE